MSKIYVIQGSTGEYSDHIEWMVCAFTDKSKAEQFVLQLTREGNEYIVKFGEFLNMRGRQPKPPPNDPNFDCYCCRFNYNLFEVDLRD